MKHDREFLFDYSFSLRLPETRVAESRASNVFLRRATFIFLILGMTIFYLKGCEIGLKSIFFKTVC